MIRNTAIPLAAFPIAIIHQDRYLMVPAHQDRCMTVGARAMYQFWKNRKSSQILSALCVTGNSTKRQLIGTLNYVKENKRRPNFKIKLREKALLPWEEKLCTHTITRIDYKGELRAEL